MHKSIFIGLVVTSSAIAAPYSCKPAAPVPCNADSCRPCFCLGPDNVQANAPVNPRTCDGDFAITVAGLFWRASQDGMEYAVLNSVDVSNQFIQANNLINAEYLTPKFKSDIGIRVALGYYSPCDGWDISLIWTDFRGKGSSFDQVNSAVGVPLDNQIILPLWSAFNGSRDDLVRLGPFATEIQTQWTANIHILDLPLGREYWVSKYLSFRPHIGLRAAYIAQAFNIASSGGSWVEFSGQPAYNDTVDIDNDFKGVGVRAGFDLDFRLGCGWSLYSELAASIVYGRFDVDHDEQVREAQSPFAKQKVLETKEHFRASRGIVDLALGLEYSTMICECKYGLTARLGYEQHLFFHQNQMWRVNRINGTTVAQVPFPNDKGENIFQQRRGTLDAGGWTLSFQFAF